MAAQRGLGEAGFVDTTPYQRSEGRIGVSVRPCSNYFEISTVTPGGASHKAGVRAGDVLLSVNETPVINWPLDMVAAMLKGETGTWVRLTLQRPAPLGGKTQFDVMVERESSLPSRPHAVENMRRIPADRGQLPAAAAPRGVGAPTVVGSMKSSADFMDPLLAPLQQINLVDGFHNGVKAITHPLHSAGTHVHASLVAFKEPTSPAQPPAACSPLPPPARIDSMNLPAQGGLVGLVNLGNTCFLNSIVQCLVHAIPLASCVVFQLEDAQQHPHDKLPPSTTAASAVSAADGGSGGSGAGDQQGAEKRAVDSELVRAFKHLCSNMWSGQHRQAIHAKTLFEALRSDRRCAALFNHRQQDAHECLCVLLDALHQDTNGVLQTGGSEECAGAGNGANSRDSGRGVGSGMRQGSLAEAGWVEVEEDMVVVGADGSPESSCVACDMADKSRGTPSPQGSEVLEVHSVVSKFVAGRLCSEVSCASCGFSTQNHEQFFTLSLPVPQRRTPQVAGARCFPDTPQPHPFSVSLWFFWGPLSSHTGFR
jgi:hypothetical protein